MRKAEAHAEPGPGCSIALRLERPLLSPISPFRPIAHSPISLDNHHFLAMFLGLVPVAP
jgi:hypothetical protein